MSIQEIVWLIVVGVPGVYSGKQVLDMAGGPAILRSPKVFLPLILGLCGTAFGVVCAVFLDRLREGAFTGLSAPSLLTGMFGGLLVGGASFVLTLGPHVRRHRRIEELQESLAGLADPASRVMLLAPPSELGVLRDQLVTYRDLLAASPHPDLCDPRRLARVQERIDQIERSLRAHAAEPAPRSAPPGR